MHNALTLWYKIVALRETEGKCFLAVYADDFIIGFQHKADAERYYDALKERLGKFNLELEGSNEIAIEGQTKQGLLIQTMPEMVVDAFELGVNYVIVNIPFNHILGSGII